MGVYLSLFQYNIDWLYNLVGLSIPQSKYF